MLRTHHIELNVERADIEWICWTARQLWTMILKLRCRFYSAVSVFKSPDFVVLCRAFWVFDWLCKARFSNAVLQARPACPLSHLWNRGKAFRDSFVLLLRIVVSFERGCIASHNGESRTYSTFSFMLVCYRIKTSMDETKILICCMETVSDTARSLQYWSLEEVSTVGGEANISNSVTF